MTLISNWGWMKWSFSEMEYKTQDFVSSMNLVNAASFISIFITYFSYHYILRKNKKYLAIYFALLSVLFFFLPSTYMQPTIYSGIYSVFTMLKYAISGLLLYAIFDWYKKIYQQKELERQNIQSELAVLKNQINPHFLFNTLNNIDSLIKSNPSRASQTLVELSDIMRYMIYDTNVETVPLAQELNYVDNYLKLQSLQYANADLVDYNINGDPKDINIAPMLFIPFIENAFKHCTDKETANAICLSFEIKDDTVIFTSINIADKGHTINKDKSSGVGLDIVKRRLELLYPDKYQLKIMDENNIFYVTLTIRIND